MDVRRLEQVVYNLVENAIKYTNNGGITVRTFLTKESIIIEIKDMELEFLSKVYLKFGIVFIEWIIPGQEKRVVWFRVICC